MPYGKSVLIPCNRLPTSSKGRNPAQRKSCIVTRALENSISLEELFEGSSSDGPTETHSDPETGEDCPSDPQ